MSLNATALHEERRMFLADADVIINRVKREGSRAMTTDESAKVSRLHTRAAEIYQQLRPERAKADATATGSDRGRKLYVGDVGSGEVFVDADSPAGACASKAYREGFREYVRSGIGIDLESVRAGLQTDIGSDGGYLAPPQFVADMVQGLDTRFWFRSLATAMPPTSQPKVTRPRRTAVADAFVWSAELQTTSVDGGYKFGEFSQTPHYLSGEFEVSADLLRSSPFPEVALRYEIESRAGDAEEPAFVAGNGVAKPLGLFFPSASGINTDRDVTGAINTLDAFIDARLSLKAPYLRSPSLCWLMHRAALKVLYKLKDTAGGPIVEPACSPGERDSLYGAPIELSESAPTGTGGSGAYTTGDYFALIGDLSRYDIQDGITLAVHRLNDSYYARRNMVGFIVRRKVDGAPRDPEAFARIKVA